jgi:hypothetical protein
MYSSETSADFQQITWRDIPEVRTLQTERVSLEWFDSVRRTYLLTPWPLVRQRTILTERPPLVDEISVRRTA